MNLTTSGWRSIVVTILLGGGTVSRVDTVAAQTVRARSAPTQVQTAPLQLAIANPRICQETGRYEIRPVQNPNVPATLDSNTYVYTINDNGVVLALAGHTNSSNQSILSWNSRTGSVSSIFEDGQLNGDRFRPTTLNDQGNIGGAIYNANFYGRPAVRIGTTISEISTQDLPGFLDGRVKGMNNAGAIIGAYNSFSAFYSANRSNLIPLVPVGSSMAVATDINDSGIAVGYAGYESGPMFRAFTYQPATGIQSISGFNVGPLTETYALRVTNNGNVLVKALTTSSLALHIVRNNTLQRTLPTGWDSWGGSATFMNDRDEITGLEYLPPPTQNPFNYRLTLLANGQAKVINEFLVNNTEGLHIRNARGINNRGEILALAAKPGQLDLVPVVLKPECL